jgi:glycosyltransferase involved in cell wall biosynthesis
MKILHVVPHLGAGIGTVVTGWLGKVKDHRIISLDYINDKAKKALTELNIGGRENLQWARHVALEEMEQADIVLVHYWDHPLLAELFSKEIPACRLAFWCHKNYDVPGKAVSYPDRFFDTSPIQGHGAHIWSCGNMERFLEIQPKPHKGFNVGYCGTVDYKKMHPLFPQMCNEIAARITEVRFTIVGENKLPQITMMAGFGDRFTFTGKVDDVAPYLAEMDVFFYPLRSDHFGTGEQVLGESMAAGVVPVTMDNPCERLIIKHGENGFRGRTEADAIELVHCLYNNPFLRGEMSEHARQSARRIYNIDNMIDKWNGVFVDMMTDPKKQRSPL